MAFFALLGLVIVAQLAALGIMNLMVNQAKRARHQ